MAKAVRHVEPFARPSKKKPIIIAVVLLLVIAVIAFFLLSDSDSNSDPTSTTKSTTTTTRPLEGEPTLTTEVLVSGLKNVWDIGFLPDSTMIFTERSGDLSRLEGNSKVLIAEVPNVYAVGEGGLMGLAVDSDFEENRYIYVCHNYKSGSTLDVRVARFELSPDNTISAPTYIVTGIPSNESGRHSGCRVRSADDGTLWIATGDTARTSIPQDPQNLGGKILRVDSNGKGIEGNLGDPFDSRIFNYGHRNLQGIALYDEPKDGSYGFSSEHGTDKDDEINLLTKGNFGWQPGPGYNENAPMTNKEKFPEAIDAIWSSGNPTIAISGMTFLKGNKWRSFNNYLAVTVLKDKHLRIIGLDENNKVIYEKEFISDFGRLRSAVLDKDGNLYLSTDNSSNDKIIKVTPN